MDFQVKTQRLISIMASAFFFSSLTYAQEIKLTLIDANGAPVSGAVMELLSDTALASANSSMNEVRVDQIDKEFVPTVTTIVAGGSASFPNSDDILHHVYSFSPAKTLDTPLYGSNSDSEYREAFDVPGVVEIGCNIHDWMLAYIYVGESELMEISNDEGLVSLSDIPPGDYRLRVWHSRLAAPQNKMEQDVTIEADGVKELELSLKLSRDRRVRRAPSANRKRYR